MRFVLAATFLPFAFNLHAQELTGALPASMQHGLDAHAIPTLIAAPFDAGAVALDDAQRDANGKLPLYARFVAAHATLDGAGAWTELPGGDRVWCLRVTSTGAQAIELLFSDAHIPNGAQVHVYDEARQQLIGGFTSAHVQPDNSFTTDMVHGDVCIIEYHEPAAVRGEGRLQLARVAHAYRMVAHAKSDACEVNVNCSEGANWTDQRDAVVRIRVAVSGGYGYCTGTLVNNTANNCKGYILTAFHCTEDSEAGDFASYQFRFRYQYPGCTATTATGGNVVGCNYRAGSYDNGGINGSDYSLLELTVSIPAVYEPYWAGWDVDENAPANGVSIHHPDSDVKKISTFTSTAQSSTFSGLTSGSHWRVVWADTPNGHGVTEPGSSGSPLFNAAKRVVGTLTGGASACVANGAGPGTGPFFPDYYGKMDYHWWENNPNPTEDELHWWLSPIGFAVYQNGSRNPCGPIGMEELTVPAPEVFPNPAQDRITIQLPEELHGAELITILDPIGRTVHTESIGGRTRIELDVRTWSTGSYMILVRDANGRAGSTRMAVVR